MTAKPFLFYYFIPCPNKSVKRKSIKMFFVFFEVLPTTDGHPLIIRLRHHLPQADLVRPGGRSRGTFSALRPGALQAAVLSSAAQSIRRYMLNRQNNHQKAHWQSHFHRTVTQKMQKIREMCISLGGGWVASFPSGSWIGNKKAGQAWLQTNRSIGQRNCWVNFESGSFISVSSVIGEVRKF